MNIRNRVKALAPMPRIARRQPKTVTLSQPSRAPGRNAPSVAWQHGCASRAPRRGILLLVVLSLLTLFLMIGMAFIVTANQYRKMNRARARDTEKSQAPVRQQKLLDEVINQLVRDTNNPNSSLRYHSLLRDMYGNDGVKIGPLATSSVSFVHRASFAYLDDLGNTISSSTLDTKMGSIGDQFFWVAVQFDLPRILTPPQQPPLRGVDNYYNGNLLTFTKGALGGTTTRIVGYDYQVKAAPTNAKTGRAVAVFSLLPLNANKQIVSQTLTANSVIGLQDSAIVNGRPFNGTGAGYNPFAATAGAKLSTTELVAGTNREISLLPNSAFFDFKNVSTNGPGTFGAFYGPRRSQLTSVQRQQLIAKMGIVGLGGSDESYDAPDYQNMVLAMLPVNPVESVAYGSPSLGNMILPSFHRPALINYWRSQGALINGSPAFEPNMLRKVMLRPSWMDHPNFTGSNPDFANLLSIYNSKPADPTAQNNLLDSMIYGPWDVDNDNDGIRDSVWVDFGAPIMKSADGKRVKALAAILLVDMDGRLNLNAHGSFDIANANINNFNATLAGGVSSDSLSPGQGYGPAEISLGPLMPGTNPTAKWNWYRRVFDGATAGDRLVLGDTSPLVPGKRSKFVRRRIGKMGGRETVPGKIGFDVAAQMKMQGMPRWASGKVLNASGTQVLGGYATMPDLYGRYAVGLNNFGQPVSEALRDNRRLDKDSPYEVDLSLGASRGESELADDGPYSMAELERILRAYDPDAGTLPSRIWELAGEFKQNSSQTTPDLNMLNRWRTTITTDSYDLPVPNVVVPEWMRVGLDGVAGGSDDYQIVMGKPPVQATFADLLEYRIRLATSNLTPILLRRRIAVLMPPDLADGRRLDINRPLGNGRDDNNNGVVDEPGENEGAFWVASNDPANALANFKNNITGQYRDDLDRDGNGTIDTVANPVLRHNLRRQLLARHLYVLAMTLVDPLPTTATLADRAARARRLAQWAINVVDFRDPDNIMTAFEYDVNPFDGWGTTAPIDGIPNATYTATSQAQLVWGTERPELLITETLAWHDRRTRTGSLEGEASQDEPDSMTKGDVRSKKDFSQDQEQRPQGAAFIELYNPWPANPAANADTHDKFTSPGNDLGVDIARTTPSGSPVWRMMVYKDGGPNRDPDETVSAYRPDNDLFRIAATPIAHRSVYFTGRDPNYLDDGVAFYNDLTRNPVPSVRPGRYLVVGAGKRMSGGVYLAKFGENTSQSSPRGIRLKTSPGTTNAVAVLNSNGSVVQDVGGFKVMAPADNGSVVPRLAGDSHRCMSSVAIIDQTATGRRRFTLSEPAAGYPRSVKVSSTTAASNSAWNGTKYVPILDRPLDDQRAGAGVGGGIGGGGGGLNPLLEDGETRLALPTDNKGDRTIPGFAWIYLQRLANPLLPFNKNTNPYLTVDSMGANVTVFNGLSRGEQRLISGAPRTFSNNYSMRTFASVQRGRLNGVTQQPYQNSFLRMQNFIKTGKRRIPQIDPDTTPPPFAASLWGSERIERASYWMNKGGRSGNGNEGVTNHYFEAIPDCTLGFLNEPFRRRGPVADTTTKGKNRFKLVPTDSNGQPMPFPWMAWNNRPYVSANELLQVPAFRSSQLLSTMSFSGVNTPRLEKYGSKPTQDNIIDLFAGMTVRGASTRKKLNIDGRYGHLMNFFRTVRDKNGTPADPSDDRGIAGLYRVLDYVQVPSRYVGTETWLNPLNFGQQVSKINDPRMNRQPPFNKISSYRDPGRVNLNTIVNGRVWDGGMLQRQLFNRTLSWNPFSNNYLPNTGHSGPLFVNTSTSEQGLLESRRGYAGANPTLDSSLLPLDPNVPTFFANPFRSSDAGNLVPLLQLRRAGIDCQELRSDLLPQITQAGGVLNQKTMGAKPIKPSQTPLMAASKTTPYNNTNRNPYFRYQPMTRLANLTTTRSNVYAVWVTIGFFEVEEAPRKSTFASNNGGLTEPALSSLYNKVYPDGYQIGKEAGNETGNIQRIREFALIDRTIPVAFEPGKNHNIDRAIRLRRRIE